MRSGTLLISLPFYFDTCQVTYFHCNLSVRVRVSASAPAPASPVPLNRSLPPYLLAKFNFPLCQLTERSVGELVWLPEDGGKLNTECCARYRAIESHTPLAMPN